MLIRSLFLAVKYNAQNNIPISINRLIVQGVRRIQLNVFPCVNFLGNVLSPAASTYTLTLEINFTFFVW